jgi:hypothetical protein
VSTLSQQIACVKREIAYRVNTYPRWVRDLRMKQHVADEQIALMRDVLKTLLAIQGNILVRDEVERVAGIEREPVQGKLGGL